MLRQENLPAPSLLTMVIVAIPVIDEHFSTTLRHSSFINSTPHESEASWLHAHEATTLKRLPTAEVDVR